MNKRILSVFVVLISVLLIIVVIIISRDQDQEGSVSKAGPQKYTIDELVKAYMKAIADEDAELVYSLAATDLYGRGVETSSGYDSIETAEKGDMSSEEPQIKTAKTAQIKRYLAYQHSEIERIWGPEAFEDYSFLKEETDLKAAYPVMDGLSGGPAEIALKGDPESVLIRLSFHGSDIAEDGSCSFRFHVVGSDDNWYVFEGLNWDDPQADEGSTVSAAGPRKYTIDELVKAYMKAIADEDAELVYSLVSTDLYGRVMETPSEYISEYISIETAEKEGMPFADPNIKTKTVEQIKGYLAYQHSEIERIWGAGAFENYSYVEEGMEPIAAYSTEVYVVKETGQEISYEEYSRLNQDYWEDVAQKNKLTVEQLKSKEYLNIFIDNLAGEPAGIAFKSDLKRAFILFSFYGNETAEDGSEFFRIHVEGSDDGWYIYEGLKWDDPLVYEGPDV